MMRSLFKAHEATKRTDTVGFVLIWFGLAGFILSIFTFPTLHISLLELVPIGVLIIIAGKLLYGMSALLRPSHSRTESLKLHAGMETERRVAMELDKLKQRGYLLLHNRDVLVPGNKAQIDHIAIGRNGLFHIETKGWSGNIHFQHGHVTRDEGKHTEDPTGQVRHHGLVLKRLLQSNGFGAVPIHGVLCFGNPNAQIVGRSERYATVTRDRLNRLILQWKDKSVLSTRESKKIYNLIQKHSRTSRFKWERNKNPSSNQQEVSFWQMCLRPRNWGYSVLGVLIAVLLVTVLHFFS